MRKLIGIVAALALIGGGVAQAVPIVGVEVTTGDLYDINPLTGATTLRTTTGLPAGSPKIYGACTSPIMNQIYATEAASPTTLYTVDVNTGATTAIGNASGATTRIDGLACDVANNILYGSNDANLYIVNPTTVVNTLVGAFGVSSMFGLTYVPGQGLYGADSATNLLYQINTSTAAITAIGGPLMTGGGQIVDIAYDPTSGRLLGTANGLPGGGFGVYDINMGTGVATLLNQQVPNMLGAAEVTTPQVNIPEPATVSLLGLGALALARRRRRR